MVCLIYTPSALGLGPAALVLWVYISGKPLMLMLQLYNVYYIYLKLALHSLITDLYKYIAMLYAAFEHPVDYAVTRHRGT